MVLLWSVLGRSYVGLTVGDTTQTRGGVGKYKGGRIARRRSKNFSAKEQERRLRCAMPRPLFVDIAAAATVAGGESARIFRAVRERLVAVRLGTRDWLVAHARESRYASLRHCMSTCKAAHTHGLLVRGHGWGQRGWARSRVETRSDVAQCAHRSSLYASPRVWRGRHEEGHHGMRESQMKKHTL